MTPDIQMLLDHLCAHPYCWTLATDRVRDIEYSHSVRMIRASARANAMAHRPKDAWDTLPMSVRRYATARSAPANAVRMALGVCVYAPERASELLKMPVPQVKALSLAGDPEALVLLPAVIAINIINP